MEIVVYRTRFATETLVDDTAAVLALYSNFDAILFFFFFLRHLWCTAERRAYVLFDDPCLIAGSF